LRKVILFSILLVFGVIGSQFLPALAGTAYETAAHVVKLLTMIGLAFIMIHVGYEFDIDRSNLRQYGWDYLVAATAAAFPWLFCCFYFIFVMYTPQQWASLINWKEALLASRFAAPTSAGILFSMLAAAGLAATWMFRKARVLSIFDDLDTVLLMIPLKMMLVGFRWQLSTAIVIMAVQLSLAWRYLHRIPIPVTWPWVLGYATLIGLVSEAIYLLSTLINDVVPVHVEVLLPAFVLGCVITKTQPATENTAERGRQHEENILERPNEKRASTIISACFMVLVGLSMPPLSGMTDIKQKIHNADAPLANNYNSESPEKAQPAPQPTADTEQSETNQLSWPVLAVHVLIVTLLSNLGKMFPVLCYRKETHWRNRLAVCVAMFPRGEVGAGILVISLAYGISGPIIIVAMFSLALNLLLTGLFIIMVKYLIKESTDNPTAVPALVEMQTQL